MSDVISNLVRLGYSILEVGCCFVECLSALLCVLYGIFHPLMVLGNRGVCAYLQRGDEADDFQRTCCVHFKSFWQLREWARTENMQLFVLTEKAFNVYFIIGVFSDCNLRGSD